MGLSRLILVGGGHSHLFVLEALARRRLVPAEALLVTPDPRQLYSGMVPGFLAGRYEAADISLDLAAIGRAAGVRLVPGHVVRVDPGARTVALADGATISYDVASIAIGGRPAGIGLPGVEAFTHRLKPVERAAECLAALEAAARGAGPEPLQVAIVGGGATGVEVAWAVRARLDQLDASRAVVSLYETSHTLVRDRGETVGERAESVCRELDITLRLNVRVEGAGPGHLVVDGGRAVPADLVFWATGTEAPPLFRDSGLPTDARGFLSVDDALAVPGCPGLFGAGDAVTPLSAPRTPKAGVYAVRMGPILARNLAAAVEGRGRYRSFRPQDDFLALLNTGDGRALGSWRGLTMCNAAALRLKERIDRRFLRRFQRLGAGTPAPDGP